MKKIKLILFKIFKKFSELLARTKIHKKFSFLITVYNLLLKKLWPYENIVEIQGSKMYVDIREESPSVRNTFQGYASLQIHEKVTTELFKKNIKEGDIVVDLGANIGYFTLLAAKLIGKKGKVFSFEPEPKNFSYLLKNIKLNNYENVFAFQKAVSDRNGKTTLYICSYDSGHHTINQYEGIGAYSRGRHSEKKAIEIEVVTLDEFLKDKTDRVDVIKMDIEGAEDLALKGMDNILKTNQNIKMFVEFFPLLIEKMGNSPREFIRKLLEDYKFSIFIVPGDYNAMKGKMLKVDSVDKVMEIIKKETDHINLFIKK